MFDSFEISTQFTSARQQITTAYQNARRTLKKRIKKFDYLIISALVWEKCTSIVHKCISIGSCSSKYNVFYFPASHPLFISTSPIINFQNIFQPSPPPSPIYQFIPTPPFIRYYSQSNLIHFYTKLHFRCLNVLACCFRANQYSEITSILS